jgi:hypothetical protein
MLCQFRVRTVLDSVILTMKYVNTAWERARIMNNKHELPEWLVNVIEWSNNEYSPGSSDYTTTSLLKPPRIYALEKLHADEVETDVSDYLASFFGSSIHTAIETPLADNERYIVEERFYREIEVDGRVFKIGGKIDLYDKETKTLSDHKYTSVAKLTMGSKDEYEAQLAINAWLLKGAGIEVENRKINLFVKDWRKAESRKGNFGYPKVPFVELEFPAWPDENVENFIRLSIHEKESALRGFHVHCDEEDRWSRPSKWAVIKNKGKRAYKIFNSEEEAKDFVAYYPRRFYIEHRPGEDIRCDQYCSVNKFCDYYINKEKVF